MGSNSKLLFVFVIAMAMGVAGCGKKKQDPGAEAMDSTPDADTATIDDGGSPSEATAPVVDESKPFDDSLKAPAPDVKGSGDLETYSVKKGDTLMKIAFNIYGDIAQWKNLYTWNKDVLKHASQLEKGTKLKYQKPDSEPVVERNGDPYLIKKGDTLAKIADDIYAKASKWKKLWENNRSLIKNPNRIYTGFYLYYQITEEERKLAESIKGKRGGGGASSASNDMPAAGGLDAAAAAPAPTAAAAPAAAAPAAVAAPAAAPSPAQTGASNSGGLSGLSNARVPASAPAKK